MSPTLCPHEFPPAPPFSGRHTVTVGSTPILRSSRQNEARRLFPLRAHSGSLAARRRTRLRTSAENPHPDVAPAASPATGKLPFATALSPTLRLRCTGRHPYRVRFFPDGRFTIHHSPFGIMNRKPPSFQAATPSKSDPPPPKRRQESTIPNLGSRIAPPFPPTGRRVRPRTPVPDFTRPLGERLTSLPWSHPESDPWRPSRGTGYG